MPISYEAYFAVNFGMNIVTIALIARCVGRLRIGHVLFAAGFGALYALLEKTPTFPQLAHPAAQLLLGVLLTLIAMPFRTWGDVIRNTALLFFATAMQAGMVRLADRLLDGGPLASLLIGAGLGSALLAGVLLVRGQRLTRYEIRVAIEHRGRRVTFDALIDTGNRLHEPLSGLPVLIVQQDLLDGLRLPDTTQFTVLPPGFRRIGYGALGGRGEMVCFYPDRVFVSYARKWLRAPDIFVALYDGMMPGAAEALAPPVIGRVLPARGTQKGMEGRLVR